MNTSVPIAETPFADQVAVYDEDHSSRLLAGCITIIALASVSLILRSWAQARIGKLFAADSWLVLCAAVCAIATTATAIVSIKNGLGKHQVRQCEYTHIMWNK